MQKKNQKAVVWQSKQNKAREKDKDSLFSQQVSTPFIAEYLGKLRSQMDRLKSALIQWSRATGSNLYFGTKDSTILKNYIKYQHEYHQYDQFDSSFELLPSISNVNLSQVSDDSLIYKSCSLFPKAVWPIRFASKFAARLNDYQIDQIYYVLGFVNSLAMGNFVLKQTLGNQYGHVRPLPAKTIPFNRFFVVKIYRQKNIFVQVGVEKVPVIKQGVIKRYQYRNYLQFLDILGDIYVENKNKLEERMNIFRQQIFDDVARRDHSEEIQVDLNVSFKNNTKHLFDKIFNQYSEKAQYFQNCLFTNAQNVRYLPITFKPHYVSSSEMSTMTFDKDLKRWLSKDHLNFMERKRITEYQRQINDALIKRFVDFQSAKVLVQLLTKIPNFKINLTEQEKDVIGQNGNVLAIGRSGTGKTTCAVLRLFSIEMLFKIRLSIYKKRYQKTVNDVRCGSDDIDQTLGLHCIFLTASPVLTHQIQRYYKKLTDNIKSELQKKNIKKRQEAQKRRKEEELLQQQETVKEEMSFQELNQSSKVEQLDQSVNKPNMMTENEESVPGQLLPRKSTEDLEEQQQINEEFKDIQLKEQVQNEGFNEDEEDMDEMKVKFQENIKKYHNLYDLDEKDYPGFFTVKSFIMMIDGVLPKPFFIRSKNTIINQDSNASWHNQRKGIMMIQNYYKNQEGQQNKMEMEQIQQEINYSDEEQLEHEYLRQIQLRQNKEKQNLTKKLQQNKSRHIMSFQVDYDYFIVHFWPKVVRKYYSSRNITAHLVWTEIYSTIKGSASSHQYATQFMTQRAYLQASSNSFLTKNQKLDIYQTFCQYQRWKMRAGGYDLMDAVNYILNYIRFRSYEGPDIHYVMIDQVQDLPHAIVYLFSKIALYGVFYSGDTAQTIAKGVGFRFCDLKSLFNSNRNDSTLQLKVPTTKHLTVNFRSHNNILQLANSVVSAIEMLFPKTIDKMKKEISDLSGPKPMILDASDQELLFYVLCGGQQKKVEGPNAIKKSPLQFGCDQVIIVRDQQSKNRVPAMLQHALCLTIYECKGLEFNDVILFNFFTESACADKWNLLRTLTVITVDVPKEDYQKTISHHKKMQAEQQESNKISQNLGDMMESVEVPVDQKFDPKTNTYHIKKIVINKNSNFMKDINDFAQLCSELKLLYTAITRPRKTLIIYDEEESGSRRAIEHIWLRLGVIQIITKEIVLEGTRKGHGNEEVKVFERIVTATDSNSWKQQGLKMYSRGYFDQAMKCFQRSGHKELYLKAQANKNADDATKKLIEIESQRNSINEGLMNYKDMRIADKAQLKKKLKKDQKKAIEKFLVAGKIFQELLMFKQAGQCFFSGKIFQKSFECFCKAFMHRQAAESLEMMNQYREAAEYYGKEDNYLKVIECLDLVNEWMLILEKIHQFTDKMSDYEKQALLKKYSALALEELVYQIEFQNEGEDQKPENNKVEVIQEKESDEEEDYDSDSDPEIEAEREYERKISSEISDNNPSRKASEVEQEKLIEIKQSVYQTLEESVNPQRPQPNQLEKIQDVSASFSELNDDSKAEQKPIEEGPKQIQESFGDLNESAEKVQILKQSVMAESVPQKEQSMDIMSLQSSFGDLNIKYDNELLPDLESIKSLVDPDDIWVKNSISQINRKMHSEYSVIDDEENYSLNVKIIKTKGNIFVQDEIMKKIVNIVSIINSSVHQFFQQFKGYQSLITVNKRQSQEEEPIDDRPEITQFEDIDPQFINIILDTLESFKLFKLCLFVCNRYHLPHKAGRYLISLGLKYSTNCISTNVVNPVLLAPSSFRKNQLQKGILASIALHAIYENVNADFLKVKVTDRDEDNKNSLGSYFIQGLILQGLYKKAVFMVNPQESFKILINYNDFTAYNTIYTNKMLKKEESSEQNKFPPEVPTSKHQIQYATMLLRKVLFELTTVYQFQGLSQRYYKQFGNSLQYEHLSSEQKIPDYLPFTKLLLTSRDTFASQFKLLLEKGYSILQKGKELYVLDFVGVFLLTIHCQEHRQSFVRQFDNNDFLEYYRCAKHIELSLKKYKGANTLNILDAALNMHQAYRVKYCKSMNFLSDTYCFVHRTSTLANELVENPKLKTQHFAFFFEQDYNLILSKVSQATKTISRKYETALVRLYTKRKNFKKYFANYLPVDFIAQQEEEILRKGLSQQIQLLHYLKQKKKVQKEIQANKKKAKVMSYEYKNRGRDKILMNVDLSDSEDENEVKINHNDYSFYRPNFNTKLKYMRPVLISLFNNHSRYSKEIADGTQLYTCGLNNYYRQYTDRQGGYNLFDAIQFKKFGRVDLYAENVLSVLENLSLYSKHNYLVQLLTLLMIQYKALEEPKGFSLKVTCNQLKYFQELTFQNLKGQDKKLSHDEVNNALLKGEQCIFEYKNKNVCEMNLKELANLICDCLDILKEEEASKYVKFQTLVLCYIININSSDEINESLRILVNLFGKYWGIQTLYPLLECKTVREYQEQRKHIIQAQYKTIYHQMHTVEVQSIGNLQKAIQDSQFDYQLEGKIIQGKKKAAGKIIRWWKSFKHKKHVQIVEGNYLEKAASEAYKKHARKPETVRDLRLLSIIYPGRNIFEQLDLLLRTQQTREELIAFLLTNVLSSSLDFHFVLMSLNRMSECQQRYFEYCAWDEQEIHEFDIGEIKEEMDELAGTIEIWRKDEKWMREKKVTFKKKKVFEVKWMTKDLHFSNLVKKRAGIKKQNMLMKKKDLLKRLK